MATVTEAAGTAGKGKCREGRVWILDCGVYHHAGLVMWWVDDAHRCVVDVKENSKVEK